MRKSRKMAETNTYYKFHLATMQARALVTLWTTTQKRQPKTNDVNTSDKMLRKLVLLRELELKDKQRLSGVKPTPLLGCSRGPPTKATKKKQKCDPNIFQDSAASEIL